MHITKKSKIPELCEWYFQNVEEISLSSRMFTYFQKHNMIRNGIQADANTLSGYMKSNLSIFKRCGKKKGRVLWGLK